MLALTESQLARLAIAATATAPEQRDQWLRELADRVDPPTIPTDVPSATNLPPTQRARTPAAVRQRKLRANRKAGRHCYKLWISDRAADALIVRCILEGWLTEEQALRPKLVAQALAAVLEEEGALLAQ